MTGANRSRRYQKRHPSFLKENDAPKSDEADAPKEGEPWLATVPNKDSQEKLHALEFIDVINSDVPPEFRKTSVVILCDEANHFSVFSQWLRDVECADGLANA